MGLIVKDFIGADVNWNEQKVVGDFLKIFVQSVDPSIQVDVTGEEAFKKDLWILHLSKGAKHTAIKVSFEELVNCNSGSEPSSEKCQKELEQKIRRALGNIDKEHRKLGFI